MDRPALSPDLNPIENLWSIVAQQVYGQSKQYDLKVSLTGAIMKSWSEIDDQTVKSLIGSMKNCCIEVIAAKGGKNKVLNDGICDFILVALSFCNMLILLFNGKIIK